jgi:hypothetical protein
MPSGTIQADVQESMGSAALSEDDAANAFMGLWEDDDESPPSTEEDEGRHEVEDEQEETPDQDADEEVDEDQEDADEDDADPDDEDDTEDDDDDESDEETPKVASDDMEVEIVVDGESKQVSVKDLKRLYGQEASLTRKSQEVSQAKKKADEDGAKYVAGLNKLFGRAQERWKPYSEIDMLSASKELDAETFKQLRADAKTAYDEVKFLGEELDGFMKQVNGQRQQDVQERAKECVEVLKEKLEGWSPALYDSIRAYAIEQGLDAGTVNSLVDPSAIMLIDKARRYDQAKQQAKGKKRTTKVVKRTGKKVLKTTSTTKSGDVKAQKATKAKHKLAETGTVDAATEAFMAGWE